MEYFPVTKTPEGLHIEGFPDAVKVLRLAGSLARRTADLALHRSDLEFTLDCLNCINEASAEPYTIRQALWRSAVVHYSKCFGTSRSRACLKPGKVYKGDSEALEYHNFFESLRNKHIAHDDNSFTQCLPGAVLNKPSATRKIAKIVCFSGIGDTLNQPNYNNLHLLSTRSREWVVAEFDKTCELLTDELEQEEYDELNNKKEMTYMKPVEGDVHRSRRSTC